MAKPNTKLAASLNVLKKFQDKAVLVIEAAACKELTRVHRERLVKAGFLQPIISGWYLPNNPAEAVGDSTQWHAHMEAFVAAYARSRFGARWQVPAEFSLLKHSAHSTALKQIQVHASGASNQVIELPYGCSAFLYRVKDGALSPNARENASGLRLLPIEESLVRAGPAFFSMYPRAAQIALRLADAGILARLLLDGGNSIVAGRLAGALTAVGRENDAKQLLAAMKAADYKVSPANPFDLPFPSIGGRLDESPHVQRIRAAWATMRTRVAAIFDAVPRIAQNNVDRLIADIETRYLADAYHSLSIEGYRVTDDLIERVMKGDWNPLTDPRDDQTRDAMAAKGYFETHKKVLELIREALTQKASSGTCLKRDFHHWHLALYSSSVAAGIVKASDLAGYRNAQVYIRNALYVPPAAEAVRGCMLALMELLEKEEHPGVRAVLGHFIFVFIHPYMDGNGRLGRFIMNYFLVTGGYAWTIVTVQRRQEYLDALEQASSYENIEPFAKFIAHLTTEQTDTPVTRASHGESSIVR